MGNTDVPDRPAAPGGASARLRSMFVARDLGTRDAAVDTLRGLSVMAMILVNHAPPSAPTFAPLVHAPWTGWTLADTIFPLFLFVVGLSVSIALPPAGTPGRPNARDHVRVGRRWLLLCLISVALVNFPYYSADALQLPGTLWFIGWCYLAAALVRMHLQPAAVLPLVALLLGGQWAALALIDVPGYGAGVITPEGNAAGYVDEILLGPLAGHLGEPVSQGLLVTAGGVSTALFGVAAGDWLARDRSHAERVAGLFAAGFVLLCAGSAWQAALPVSKTLWTGPYAVLMGGLALQLLALAYWLPAPIGRWTHPLRVVGVNALFIYLFAQCLQRVLVYGRVAGDDGAPIRLRVLIYERLVAPWAPGEGGSLLYASAYLLLCYALAAWLYRRRIFIKL
jgi:predicted acyltransferase